MRVQGGGVGCAFPSAPARRKVIVPQPLRVATCAARDSVEFPAALLGRNIWNSPPAMNLAQSLTASRSRNTLRDCRGWAAYRIAREERTFRPAEAGLAEGGRDRAVQIMCEVGMRAIPLGEVLRRRPSRELGARHRDGSLIMVATPTTPLRRTGSLSPV